MFSCYLDKVICWKGKISQLQEISPDSNVYNYLEKDGSLKEPYSRRLTFFDPGKGSWESSMGPKSVFASMKV